MALSHGLAAGLAAGPAVNIEGWPQVVHGKGSVSDLAAQLSELPGVRAVTSDDANAPVD